MVFMYTAGAMVPANGAVVFDNLDEGLLGLNSVGGSIFIAQSFSTNDEVEWLEQVTLNLARAFNIGNGTLSVLLLEDNGSTPGDVIATVGTILESDIGVSHSSASSYDFRPDVPFLLATDTRYWIRVISSDPSSMALWASADSVDGFGVTGERVAYSSNYPDTLPDPYDVNINFWPQMMQITTAAVPEASTLSFAAAAGFLLCRRGIRPPRKPR